MRTRRERPRPCGDCPSALQSCGGLRQLVEVEVMVGAERWLKIGNIINTHMTDQNSASSNESQMFFWKEIDVLKGNNNDRFGSDVALSLIHI